MKLLNYYYNLREYEIMKLLSKNMYICITIILSSMLFRPCQAQASFIDDIKNATIPLLGIRVDFVGTGPNHPQPSCDDNAKWHFKSVAAILNSQTAENLCSGDTFELQLGTIVSNSFAMSILQKFFNWMIDKLNHALRLLGLPTISSVNFAHEYHITFSDVYGWEKPAKLTSYVTLVKFDVIQTKNIHIDLWWPFPDITIPNVPIQFGMSHKAEYRKIEEQCFRDADGDQFGDINESKLSLYCENGWVDNSLDCDDTDAAINPDAIEICNDKDDECDGEIDEGLKLTCYIDLDNDNCGDPNEPRNYCEGYKPAQCIAESCDCDDTNPDRFASNPEIKCDGVDQDCDKVDDCPYDDCITISDVPLETLADPPPPLIMLVIDDSGSMGWNIMTDEIGGKYDSNTDLYSNSLRAHYRCQWYEYNKIYYNPTVTYEPWVRWNEMDDVDPPSPKWSELPDANPTEPRNNPSSAKPTTPMNKVFLEIKGVQIYYSHYYVFSKQKSRFFLVNINIDTQSIDYYRVNAKSNYTVKKLVKTDTPPDDIKSSRTYKKELQNFANWYSFFRTRLHTAKAAISKMIDSLEGVKVGIITLNNTVQTHVLPIKCTNNAGSLDDKSDKLLNLLYQIEKNGGTPLRKSLQKAGKYFTEGSGSNVGNWPYASADEGGACQQAFSILLTDGYWNGNKPNVKNADGDNNTKFDTSCYSDSYLETLADVAMQYYETDLSKSLENKVPPRRNDINSQQHMVTFCVAFGAKGTLNPFDNYPNCPPLIVGSDCSDYCPKWPKVKSGQMTTIDDLWHAAVNGRGEYFSANNPQDLIHAIESIGRQVSVVGSAASVAVNGQMLEQDSKVFQCSYNSRDWSGDLRAYGTDGSNNFDYETPTWSAQEKLDSKPWDTRKIITSNGGKQGVYFNADLSDELLAKINPNIDLARKITRYIRGDAKDEKQNKGRLRTRYHKLGDIVHSEPLFFKNFVFIGANDGMGHVFNANTGEEVAAYVPNLVFENLYDLSVPGYTHKFYCDATPTVKETDDGTYLVGGLGKGGRGYYCLKVSSSMDYEDMPQWEFPSQALSDSSDDLKMGYSYSKPYIVNSNINKWIVIFGNGYASKSGKAVLYIRNVKTGEEIKTINTEFGSYDMCNGLSTPSLVDVNFDGKVDYVFAGDLLGNLWKFDLTSDDAKDWKIAYGTDETPQPLFQARNSDGIEGKPQAITCKPDVMSHCVHGKSGFIVIFGTGRYITEGDAANMDQQTIYGIWDWQNNERNNAFFLGSFTKERTLSNVASLGDDYKNIGLLEQKIELGYISEGYKVVTDNTMTWFPDKDENDKSYVGWYFNLPLQYERIIDDPMIREGKVLLISIIPASTRCGVKSHSAIYLLDACNGGRLNEPVIKVDDVTIEIEPENINNPKLPPSVIILDTVVKPPAFIHDNGRDRLIFGDLGTDTQVPGITIDSEQGRYYWKY